ncbi:MAG: protein kinase domain-containing protein [Akkermansiaceae bacterium]
MSDDPQEFTSFEAPPLEELDNLLAGYQFESFIAQGGMGAVYLARQTSLDRLVAVKVLPRVLGEDEEFRKSFQTEAKLMAKLNHPNLIGIYDFGDIDGMLYIIMEFVKGKSLHHSAHGKAIKQETAVEIISGICSGLAAAHKEGILHRDIKPANILLGKRATPKVGDFGLARPSGMTESGVIYGTPGYSAPEVLGAPEKVDNRTDIFAVGVMFYELLTGHMPGDTYVTVTEYAEADARFDKIIQKAIHADIEQRHDSAQDFADDINEVLNSPSSANRLLVSSGVTAPVRISVPSGMGGNGASLAAGAKRPSSMAPTSVVSVKQPVGGDSKLIRNMVVIFLLIGAIYVVLEMKETKEGKMAEEQKANDAEFEKNKKENEARKAAHIKESEARVVEGGSRPRPLETTDTDFTPETPETPAPVEVKLPPLEALENAKEFLSNGERPMSMMPDTIFMRDQDSRIIMYVDKEMTWDEADTWAREYGGYLAVCRTKSDLNLFMKQIPADAGDVWLGAGCSGDKGWSWVDDTPWTDAVSIKPTYNRSFAKVSKYGSVGKTNGDKKLTFFIEWRADGTNPAELEYRLLRTSDTLTDINPKYPAGTITVGARNYCIVKTPVTHSEASDFAIASGGHLIAISNDDEKYEVEAMIAKYCKPGDAIWTAGEKDGNDWVWQTGEKWLDLPWVPSHPKSSKYVVISAGNELMIKDSFASKKADGFIIEWSKDKSRVKVEGMDDIDVTSPGVSNGLSSLKSKAKLLVSKQRAVTEKKHAFNVKKLRIDLETYMRGLSQNVKAAEAVSIDKIILMVKDQPRVPLSIAGQGSSERARDYTNYAVEKQARIDLDHNAQIELLRTGYIKQLLMLKQDMENKGQSDAVNSILQEARNIGDSVAEFEEYFK